MKRIAFALLVGLAGCQPAAPSTTESGLTYQVTETPTALDILVLDAQQLKVGASASRPAPSTTRPRTASSTASSSSSRRAASA